MMTRFAAAAALLLAASLTTATAAGAEPGDTVTYNVDADGPLILAPWSTSFTSEATYGLFAVGAKTVPRRGSTAACRCRRFACTARFLRSLRGTRVQ